MTSYDRLPPSSDVGASGDRSPMLRARPAARHASPESRSRSILTALLAVRDGDFSTRLPTNWPELDGLIATTFNQTITQRRAISREFTKLRRIVGEEGRLRQRV